MEVKTLFNISSQKSKIYIGSIKTYKSQDNFAILDALKMSDNVLILNLQEEIPFNECDQAIIQVFLPHLAS